MTLTGHTANVTSLAWHAEAKWLVSGSEDGTVKIWDVRCASCPLGPSTRIADRFWSRTASPQRNYAHLAPVNDIALHSNQGELISCDQSGAIKIWDLGGDCCSHELVRSLIEFHVPASDTFAAAAAGGGRADAVRLGGVGRLGARRWKPHGAPKDSRSATVY